MKTKKIATGQMGNDLKNRIERFIARNTANNFRFSSVEAVVDFINTEIAAGRELHLVLADMNI
jgi:hypothetical protein